MIEFVAVDLSGTTDWQRLLEAYSQALADARTASPEATGWVPRLARLEGIESPSLSSLHGKLIALGYLNCEISGKSGMQYQLTPLGRRALERGLTEPALAEANAAAAESASDDE